MDFQSVFISIIDTFPWIQLGRFLLHITNHLFFTMRISTKHSNSILVHFVGWLFYALQTLANQWLPNYHINMISSNILSLGSFFSQHRPIDTRQGHYKLTFQRNFSKQNRPIWEEPPCSRHLYITDNILRSRWCPLQRACTVHSRFFIILFSISKEQFLFVFLVTSVGFFEYRKNVESSNKNDFFHFVCFKY